MKAKTAKQSALVAEKFAAPHGRTNGAMSRQRELEARLARHFAAAQTSERWAMYRIIALIVDFANETLGLTAYFEFNQISSHRTSQSVDIALLRDGRPVAMIEAKRVDRRISSNQLKKYLAEGGEEGRGAVSNGGYWILCKGARRLQVSIWDAEARRVNSDAVAMVVAFLRGEVEPDGQWSDGVVIAPAALKPIKQKKAERAEKENTTMIPVCGWKACAAQIELLKDNTTAADKNFLRALLASLQRVHGNGRMPEGCCWEFNSKECKSTRAAFWDDRVADKQRTRVGRIEFDVKSFLDILVATRIVDAAPELEKICASVEHDKGPHMRRFCVENDNAVAFGNALGKVLFQPEQSES